jgi:hypothetical protein
MDSGEAVLNKCLYKTDNHTVFNNLVFEVVHLLIRKKNEKSFVGSGLALRGLLLIGIRDDTGSGRYKYHVIRRVLLPDCKGWLVCDRQCQVSGRVSN